MDGYQCPDCKEQLPRDQFSSHPLVCSTWRAEPNTTDSHKREVNAKDVDLNTINLHKEDNYLCHICSKTFRVMKRWEHHVKCHNMEPVICGNCGKTYKTKLRLKRHVVNCHTGEQFKCSQCPRQYQTDKTLKDHMKLKHGEIPLRFPCEECDKIFLRPHKICISHTHRGKIRNGGILFKCENGCDFSTNQRQMLNRHLSSSRCNPANPFIRNYLCSRCYRMFTTEKAKVRHERIHTDGNPFKCDQCAKTFSQRWSLRKHARNSCVAVRS
jgi:KRAB domain-containing zinc finger protein